MNPYSQEQIDQMNQVAERMRQDEENKKVKKLEWGLCSTEFSILASKINEIIDYIN